MVPFSCKFVALYSLFLAGGVILPNWEPRSQEREVSCFSFPFPGTCISVSDTLHFSEICMDGSSCLLNLSIQMPHRQPKLNMSKINSLSFYPKSVPHSVPPFCTHSFSNKPKPEAVPQTLLSHLTVNIYSVTRFC